MSSVELNQLTDVQSRMLLRASMGGDAVLRVMTVRINDCPLEEALRRYEAKFIPASESQMSRCTFDTLKQRQGEDVLSYHGRCRLAYMRAYPEADDDTPLIRRFYLGLTNERIRRLVATRNPATFQDALEVAQTGSAVESMEQWRSEREESAPMEVGAVWEGRPSARRAWSSPPPRREFQCSRCRQQPRDEQRDQRPGEVPWRRDRRPRDPPWRRDQQPGEVPWRRDPRRRPEQQQGNHPRPGDGPGQRGDSRRHEDVHQKREQLLRQLRALEIGEPENPHGDSENEEEKTVAEATSPGMPARVDESCDDDKVDLDFF